MVQLQEHKERQFDKVLGLQNAKLFNVLMQMAQNVADQKQVSGVVDIIEELISAEEQVRQAEYNAEQLRLQKYAADVERFQANIDGAKADSLEL